MLDVQLIRGDLDAVAARLATRGVTIDVAAFRALEEQRKKAQVRTQELQARRNATSTQIGEFKRERRRYFNVDGGGGAVGDELKK